MEALISGSCSFCDELPAALVVCDVRVTIGRLQKMYLCQYHLAELLLMIRKEPRLTQSIEIVPGFW